MIVNRIIPERKFTDQTDNDLYTFVREFFSMQNIKILFLSRHPSYIVFSQIILEEWIIHWNVAK